MPGSAQPPDSAQAPDAAKPHDAARRRRFPADRPVRWGLAIAAAAVAAGTYAMSWALARQPQDAESVFNLWPGPAISRELSRLTGAVPFSVADILIAGYSVWLVAVALKAMASAARRRRRWRNALAGGARRVVRDAGVLVSLFYLLWGWNYARPGFAAGAGWPEWTAPDTRELVALTEAAVEAANRAYLELHGIDDAGRPTSFADDPTDVNAALDSGWVRAASHLGLPPGFSARYGRVKRPRGSVVLRQLGILGIYFPFTAEANVVRGMPAVWAANAMGHEQAHQRGITSEAEAGFLGFLAAGLAPGRMGRYSAAVYAMGRLAGPLARADRAEAERISATRLPGVRRDLADLTVFLSHGSRVGRRVQTAVNDRYLRANRVPGGTANYGMSTQLLVMYARQHGGVLIPPR